MGCAWYGARTYKPILNKSQLCGCTRLKSESEAKTEGEGLRCRDAGRLTDWNSGLEWTRTRTGWGCTKQELIRLS